MRYLNLLRTFRNWYLYLFYKWGGRRQTQLAFVTRQGVKVLVPTRLINEFKEVFFSGDYARFFEPGTDVKSVVDIGANVGFFTLYAADRFPGATIHSYEPVPENYSTLRQNRELNPNRDITLHPCAVGDSNGVVSIQTQVSDGYTTSAHLSDAGGPGVITVDCHTLGWALDQLPDGRCDFLKVDCEGAEYRMFYHADKAVFSRVRHLAMETHHVDDDDGNMPSLARFLRVQGFRVTEFEKMLYATRSETAAAEK